MTTKAETIVAMSFDAAGRPFSFAIDLGHCYDVDWCERDQRLYYHMSGGGAQPGVAFLDPQDTYWLAAGYRLPDWVSLADYGKRIDIPDPRWLVWPPDLASEGDTVWCTVCDDHMPSEDVCEHLVWDDDAAVWAGLGAEDQQ